MADLLSCELLLSIFSHMGFKDIKKAAAVCRKWERYDCGTRMVDLYVDNIFTRTTSTEERGLLIFKRYCRRTTEWPLRLLPRLLAHIDVDTEVEVQKTGVNPHAWMSNRSSIEKRTLLWSAAACGRAQVVDILLEAGAAVDKCSRVGNTALSWGVISGSSEVVASLIGARADVNASDECYGMKHWFYARDEYVIMAMNPQREDRRGLTPCFSAADYGFTEILQLLIEAEADIHRINTNGTGRRRLRGEAPLHAAASSLCSDAVDMLLENRAFVDVTDEYGRTPLLLACLSAISSSCEEKGRIRTVSSLLAASTDVTRGCRGGCTALIIAAGEGDLSLVDMLLCANSDPTAETRCGVSATMAAVEYPEVVQRLNKERKRHERAQRARVRREKRAVAFL